MKFYCFLILFLLTLKIVFSLCQILLFHYGKYVYRKNFRKRYENEVLQNSNLELFRFILQNQEKLLAELFLIFHFPNNQKKSGKQAIL